MLRVLLLALALTGPLEAEPQVRLELRVFAGAEEVTSNTRISVYRAGERATPIAQATPVATTTQVAKTQQTGRLEIMVPPGLYDVQVLREQDERVVGIRWAERLVVMAYPDEGGRHLEVVNLETGFGALQVRAKDASGAPDVALFATGQRVKESAPRLTGDGYALFVAPAATYDVRTRDGEREVWHAGVDVPLDRTRLLIVR